MRPAESGPDIARPEKAAPSSGLFYLLLFALQHPLGAFEQQADALLHFRTQLGWQRLNDIRQHLLVGVEQLIVQRLRFRCGANPDDAAVNRIVFPPDELLFH